MIRNVLDAKKTNILLLQKFVRVNARNKMSMNVFHIGKETSLNEFKI